MTCYRPRCYFCQVYAGRLNRSYRSCKCPRQAFCSCASVHPPAEDRQARFNNKKRCCPRRYRTGTSEGSFGISEFGFSPTCRDY